MTQSSVRTEGANLTGWLAGLLVILLVIGVAAVLWIQHHGV
jgi:hypothetical protein